MKIVEYDKADPLQVLHLTMLALDSPLTPERVALIRRTDPRPFPCFTLNAVEEATVLGQVGVSRLPMISIEGREDVGGVWGMCTYPQHTGGGAAPVLLEEAHSQMRAAGLRFSTLRTNRFHTSYKLYQQHGYVDMIVWAAALARWETAHQPTRLRAHSPGPEGFDFVERLFQHLASDYLGFAWRHMPSVRLRECIKLEETWILWLNSEAVGYAFARRDGMMLRISIQLLRKDIDAVEAIAALASQQKAEYVQVTVSRPSDIASLRRAAWQVAQPTRDAFMVKPLLRDLTAADARSLFGIGTDRFLLSWLDTT